jgi:putative selenate reductase molybdopterin-binding subunit
VKKLVTGRAAFVDDLAPPGLLHAALVGSPHPHARITGIDASAARALPGVIDVITHEPDSWVTPEGPGHPLGLVLSGVVGFVGAPVAIVVAEDPEIGARAAEAVRVAYAPLPAVSWNAGLAGDRAPFAKVEVVSGDVARAFLEADRVVEVIHRFDRSRILPPEPPTALAWLDEDAHLVVRSASTSPLRLRLALADALGVAGGRIRVERPEVGGDFGARGGVLLEIVCGLVTLRTGRPCRFALRPDHPAGSFDHAACTVEARASIHAGALTGIAIRLRQDIGQAPGAADVEAELRRAAAGVEMYAIPALAFEAVALATHGSPAGGSAPLAATLALEALVDEVANAIGEEPLALRQRLLNDPAPKGALRASLERGLKEAAADRRPTPTAEGTLRGLGISLARSPLAGADAAATLARNEDGSFTVAWSPCDASTSASAALEALAARSLGIPSPSMTVNLSLHAEPPASGVADLWITARAVEAAGVLMAAKLKAKRSKGRASIVVSASHHADRAPVPAGAFIAEVDVDAQTGIVTLLRLIQALGAGATEPLLQAKAEGDALRGVGFALFEPPAASGAGRGRMRSVDLPVLKTLLAGEGRPRPLGILPIGEVAFLGAAAAVANAVARACGVRITELPLSPDRVRKALEARTTPRASETLP